MLGFEAAIAFMLEAAFIGIMMFGWHRVSRAAHLTATGMVALGGPSPLSGSWWPTPGCTPPPAATSRGALRAHQPPRVDLQPGHALGVSHMWIACLETTLFLVGG